MHANYTNLSSDHFPQESAGRRYYFVGDGCEALFCASTEIECLDEMRRLNRISDDESHTVYVCDIDSKCGDDYVFPHERKLAIEAFGE